MSAPKTETPPLPEFEGTSRFVIQRRLGQGGMGVVYLAHDVERNTPVALKTLSRLDATVIACLKNEFRSISGVVHPNLVTLHELVSENDRWFLTMEAVDGVSFSSWVEGSSARAKPDVETATAISPVAQTVTMTPPATPTGAAPTGAPPTAPQVLAPGPWCDVERLRAALRQLVEGVRAIHAAGKLHRDLKPSNVLVTPTGRVVILDFGLTIERAQQGTAPVGGTPIYMAPEQMSAGELTPASDWYAVGVMIYQALTGHLPFAHGTDDILRAKRLREPPPPSTLAQGIPEDLDRLCADCLRLDPSKRPSGAEILRRLSLGANSGSPMPEELDAPLLVGREEPLARLREAFERARRGDTVTVYVSGRSGMGKSAFIESFLRGLGARGAAVVLAGRCYERESVPYKAWDSLIDALAAHLDALPPSQVRQVLPRDIHALARVFPVLGNLRGMEAPPEPRATDENQTGSRQRAFDALKELLQNLGRLHPVVLHIDDLQWGDSDSARLMAHLLAPPSPPLLLVCSYRSEEEETSEFFQTLREFRMAGSLQSGEERRLETDRLGQADATRLALALLGPQAAPAEGLPALIAREADGSPFFIAQLARHVRARGGTAEAALQGVSMESVLLERVGRLPEDARRLLEVLSVAARPLEQGLAASAAGLASDAATVLGVLRAAHLVRTHGARVRNAAEPYHDRVREVITGSLEPARLREHHHRLAHVLEASGRADPELLAEHLERAGEPSRALGYALAAAERAEAALAFERAARLYQRALAWAAPGDAAGLRLRLANALVNAGRGAEAAPLLLAAAGDRTDTDAVELRRRAAEQLLISGHIDEGLRVLRGVLGWAGVSYPETGRGALLALGLRIARLRLRGLGFRERAAATLPPEQLLRLDVCYSAGKGLALVDPVRGAGFFATHLLLALKLGEPRRIALALGNYGPLLCATGEAGYARGLRTIHLAMEMGERLGDPYIVAAAMGLRAAMEMCLGRWSATLEHVSRARELMRARCSGISFELETGAVFSEVSLLWMGRLHELERLVDAHVRSAMERRDLFAATFARMHTWYTPIAADDVSQAKENMREAMSRWSRSGIHIMHSWALYGESRYAMYEGNPGAAWEQLERTWPALVEANILRAQFHRVPMTLMRGNVAIAAATARQAGAPRALLRAAEKDAARLEKEGTRCAVASAALLRACLAAARGRLDAALGLFETAAQGFDAAEMALHAACARRRKGQLLGGDEGRALITAADALLRGQGIRAPARWAALYAPGLDDG
jgi:serine/threonine protein kinase/tetratricopeptide (TPR) repeat protein